MKYGNIILEKKEYVYLKRLLNISGYAQDNQTQQSLLKLSNELKDAHIVDEEEIPNDVIRFNSSVKVVSNRGWEKTLQVVMPGEKDVESNKVSILTPMGSALIGYAQDDIINWEFPSGHQELKIETVAQDKSYNFMDLTL